MTNIQGVIARCVRLSFIIKIDPALLRARFHERITFLNPGGTTSSALVWSELRRQRELHEEKLKKRKHRLLNEKRKKAGLDDVSEGGAYSLRSADVDEGFGVSMMSADITTATWGGSTQPSSTQNDSAVSEDESEVGNQEGEVSCMLYA